MVPLPGTEGGGNAPISWMPTAVKNKKEEEEGPSALSVCFRDACHVSPGIVKTFREN